MLFQCKFNILRWYNIEYPKLVQNIESIMRFSNLNVIKVTINISVIFFYITELTQSYHNCKGSLEDVTLREEASFHRANFQL